MKYDLNTILLEELKEVYGLHDENENYIWKYLEIRTSVKNNKKEIKKNDLMEFIVDELNICKFKDNSLLRYLVYENERYDFSSTMLDFIDYLRFRAEMYGDMNIQHEKDEIFQEGSRKSRKYRGEESFKSHRDYNRLLILNEKYGATPLSSSGVKGFKKSPNHNPMKRSLEETLKASIENYQKQKSKNILRISEKTFENHLVKNLDLIEENLTVIGRQVEVTGGRIDVLAKDSKQNICIIEIKIAEDKSIIWQALHYPMEIKKIYGNNIRMITIAPSYSESILNSLKSLTGVEIFKYEAEIANEEICNLIIKKLL